jgi:DNA modification methylase
MESSAGRYALILTEKQAGLLREGIHNSEAVKGYTHNFYRYPARFSPVFARAVIEVFTRPGDTVFDPFMGGGTSLVEARSQ